MIQSVELCKETLSVRLATKISIETGVDLNWLLNGDPKAPIKDGFGRPYKWATFEMVQSGRRVPGKVSDRDIIKNAVGQIREILSASRNEYDRRLAASRINKALGKVSEACTRQ